MLRAAVIGIGNMGMNHVRTFSKINNTTLVAVSDTDTARKKFLSSSGPNFYQDFFEMITAERPDLVSICVPTSLHYKVAQICLEEKIHVLLEKPIASSVGEARKLLKTAAKNNVKLLIGHTERYNPAVVKAKELIQSGELGKICAIAIRRVGGFPPQIKDANIAVDLAIHDIDIANYLLDDLPKELCINKQKFHTKTREDSVEFFMKYKNKASVYIQANWISPVKIRKMNVTGTNGYFELDYITQTIEFYKSNFSKFKQASKGYSDYILQFTDPDRISIAVEKKEPLEEEILYFLNAIEKDKKIDSGHAVDALKIALA